MRTGKLLRTIDGNADSVVAIAFCADGQTLVSGSEDKTINIWNLRTGELQLRFNEPIFMPCG